MDLFVMDEGNINRAVGVKSNGNSKVLFSKAMNN